MSNPDVLFAGYRMPHPLENKIEVKVQTNGKVKPTTAFAASLEKVMKELESIGKEFDVYKCNTIIIERARRIQ